jgi:hypothetical protein
MANLATIVNNILADSGIDDINVVVTTGSYTNPSWIVSLPWTKITGTPTTLAGYGITDAVPSSRTISINGTTQDLSANRTYNVGTVTSVGLSAPTGFSVANSPVTGAGTLALSFASGFSLPTNASQANWDAAYNDKINSAAVTGTTTKTLTLTQQDGGTITASWTDINTDAVTSVFGRTGAVVAANGDYTTAQVTESGNLYFTNARSRAALSFVAGSGAYNSTTGVITIPTNTSQLANGANFITLASLSAGAGISYNNTTGVIASTITQYTDALARLAISLTTTGASGASTYNNTTGVLNVPTYTLAGLGGQPQLNGTGFVKASGTTITYDNSTYQVTSEKAQPNGYASLDSNGKVPLVQINDALIGNVNFQGLWNAATNTPTLANPPASGTKGYYYIVSTAGTFAGISFEVGDWIISNGTAWGKVDNTDAVSSVFGRTGNVTASNGDYNTSQVTENTNLYFTNARVLATALTGYVVGTNAALLATDTILGAFGKVQAQINAKGSGTVTSVAALTLGTTGTDLSSSVANSTTTPVITLNVPTASAANRGALSAADWTTFNNKQNALTNPVTGTGTTNYLPKFTGASTIGNSQVFDNGTSVGINTPTPSGSWVLDVWSNNATWNTRLYQASTLNTAYNSLFIEGAMTGAKAYFGIGGSATGNTSFRDSVVIGSLSSHPLVFNTADAERMRIFTDGNVSISNTPSNAGFKLDVNGTGRFSGNLTTSGIASTGTNTMLSASSSTAGLIVRGGSSIGSASLASGQILIGQTPSYRLSLAYDDNTGYAYIDNLYDNANSNIYFRVRTNGTPINALTLFGTGAATFTGAAAFQSGITSSEITVTSSDPLIRLSPTSGTEIFFQKLSTGNGDYLRLYDGTNYTMFWKNQQVGIGTNGAFSTYMLDVNGTGRFTSNLLAQKVQVGTAATINDATGVGNTLQFANYSAGVFVTGSADSYIYKTSSVFGGLAAQTLIFQTRSDVAGGGFAFVGGSTPSVIAKIDQTGAATFSSSVTASSYITSLINVGFVNTNASQAGFVADYTGTGALKVSFSTYNDFMNIYNETNGYSIINFTRSTKNIAINPTGGNVGIGIAVPSYKLDVYSSTTATQAIANFAAANYGSPSSRTIIQIGTQYEDGSSRIASVNTTGNQSALIFQSHAATSGVWNDAMYINGSGNVLIGTTTDSSGKLQVLGADNTIISQIKSSSGMLQIYPFFSTHSGPIIQALDGGAANYVPLRIESLSTTFSSSVTATQGFLTATANTYAGGALRLTAHTGGTQIFLTSVGTNFALSNGGSADHLLIASTGAATFSSSVALSAIFNSTSNTPYIRFDESSNAKFFIGQRGAVSGSGGTGYDFYTVSSNDIRFFTGGSSTTRLCIATSGNLLVGTTTDNANSRLTINSNADGNSIALIGRSSDDSSSIDFNNNSVSTFIGTISASSLSMDFGSQIDIPLIFYTNSVPRMRITNDGNLLINTTNNPGATLNVNGTIRTGAPSGGSAVNWKLGTARGGTVTTNATVRVEIDGVLVDLVAKYV